MKSFGTASREGHDAGPFYARRLYARNGADDKGAYLENPLPPDVGNSVLCADSRQLSRLPDSCLHLIITSPPYNVGKEYDEDLSLREYVDLLHDVFRECLRVLVPGGRICINVANLGRKPYVPLHSYVIAEMDRLGFLMRGEIIWDKSASAGSSTAWGSWKSAANPTLRDVHEYVLVFSKGSYQREKEARTNTISREEFLGFTKSIWSFGAESARRVKHPAPFPVELPYRLIQLYSFADDVVFDPFGGSGTTAIAALRAGRQFVLCDSSEEYVAVAAERIRQFMTTGVDGKPKRARRGK
ncbi:MAG: site-specific DNA-methyltransferase [Ignavibacteria bacterium]|nr:site-specific DNA-methyltransferase [Ignavibacteria bacterium]